MSTPGPILVVALAAVALLSGADPLAGQDARGSLGSTAQLVEMRPLAPLEDGCPATEACFRTLEPQVAATASQDLSLTAWGFGVQGLSATVLLRTRQRLGGAFRWPRSDDAFDAMLAYAELSRGGLLLRGGRQEVRSGLGFPSFDGLMARWTRRRFRLELYGGRSLARGLREPADEALRGLEDFLPDRSAYLFGAAVRGRFGLATATARYHREILDDRSGLASERASVDAAMGLSFGSVRAALDYDVARRSVGKAHVTFSRPFDDARWLVEGTLSRYVPYFSLSTIWGFFDPVAYNEGMLRIGWAPAPVLTASVTAGVRKYGDPGTAVVVRPLEDTGRRGRMDVRWHVRPAWTVSGAYDLEWGPGGFLSSAEAGVRWSPSGGSFLALSGRTFQRIEQYRLGDGRAVGGGWSGGLVLAERITLSGGASVTRLRSGGGAGESPWNQLRAWSSVRYRFGGDPGTPRAETNR